MPYIILADKNQEIDRREVLSRRWPVVVGRRLEHDGPDDERPRCCRTRQSPEEGRAIASRYPASARSARFPSTPSRVAFSLLMEERKLFDPIAFVQRSWKLDRTAPVVLLPPLLKLGQQVLLFGNPIVKGNHPSGLRSIISCQGTRRWVHTHHSTAASTSGALVGSAGAGNGAVAATSPVRLG